MLWVVVGARSYELPRGRFREVHLRMDFLCGAHRFLYELLIPFSVKVCAVRCDTVDSAHGPTPLSYLQPSSGVLPVVWYTAPHMPALPFALSTVMARSMPRPSGTPGPTPGQERSMLQAPVNPAGVTDGAAATVPAIAR